VARRAGGGGPEARQRRYGGHPRLRARRIAGEGLAWRTAFVLGSRRGSGSSAALASSSCMMDTGRAPAWLRRTGAPRAAGEGGSDGPTTFGAARLAALDAARAHRVAHPVRRRITAEPVVA